MLREEQLPTYVVEVGRKEAGGTAAVAADAGYPDNEDSVTNSYPVSRRARNAGWTGVFGDVQAV